MQEEEQQYRCRYTQENCPAAVAMRIQSRAARRGFDWTDIEGVLAKVQEEVAEVIEAVQERDFNHAQEELGDLLFAALSVARFLDADPVVCLDNAARRFQKRFDFMEKLALEAGHTLESCTAESLDDYWEQVKKLMRQ